MNRTKVFTFTEFSYNALYVVIVTIILIKKKKNTILSGRRGHSADDIKSFVFTQIFTIII